VKRPCPSLIVHIGAKEGKGAQREVFEIPGADLQHGILVFRPEAFGQVF
jgi:hypothetical protein